MACCLAVSEAPCECEGCGAEIPPGLVGFTDEIFGADRLAPQCKACLMSVDRRLAAAWITSIAALDLETLDAIAEALLNRPEFADLANEEPS